MSTTTTKRLEHVERDVGDVKEDVAGIKEGLSRTSTALEHLADRVDRGFASVADRSRPHWATLAAWAGVAVTLAALAASPMLRDIRKLEAATEALQGAQEAALRAQIERLQDDLRWYKEGFVFGRK